MDTARPVAPSGWALTVCSAQRIRRDLKSDTAYDGLRQKSTFCAPSLNRWPANIMHSLNYSGSVVQDLSLRHACMERERCCTAAYVATHAAGNIRPPP